jgi:NADP-dependent 3-hydroxy acid dehydrogenase YdfG
VARRTDRLVGLAAEIADQGGQALVVPADVADGAAVRDAVETVVAEWGRLDTVIANAGVMLLGPIENAPVDEWQRMMDLNVLGLMHTVHASLPHLLTAAEQPPRRIADVILVSSVAGRVVRLGSGVYNASKHAVGAFGEALRQEVTGRHVRVCLIEPGAVDTELATHNRPEILEGMRKRFGDIERLAADDIADAVRYVVTRPRHASVNEVLIRPTEQQG